MYQNETYLMHHGVKGMKWGVRHDPKRLSSAGRKVAKSAKNYISKKAYNSDYATYRRSKSMTDDQLRTANKRFQMEQQYRQNVRSDVRDGRTYVGKQLNKMGNIFVSGAIGAAAGTAGAIYGKKLLNDAANKFDISWLKGKQ